jgi:hypothetical protein
MQKAIRGFYNQCIFVKSVAKVLDLPVWFRLRWLRNGNEELRMMKSFGFEQASKPAQPGSKDFGIIQGGSKMKNIYVGIMLFAGLLLSGQQAHAQLVDSVKFVIGEVSVINPHPDLASVSVSCAIYDQGRPIGGSGRKIIVPFKANNEEVVVKFTKPFEIKGKDYVCILNASDKNGNGVAVQLNKVTAPHAPTLNPLIATAVNCSPSGCQVQGTFK